MKVSPARARFGIFELDLKTGELCSASDKKFLQEQSVKILGMLIEADGELVSREAIKMRLWPNDTIVEFDHSINAAVKNLRRALNDSAEEPTYIETIPRRGYRFIAPVTAVAPRKAESSELSSGSGSAIAPQPEPVTDGPVGHFVIQMRLPTRESESVAEDRLRLATVPAHGSRWAHRKVVWFAGSLVLAAVVPTGTYFYLHSRTALKLGAQNTVVVSDFTNTTGDPIFDGTLKEALLIQLQQSPFLNLLPNRKIAATLKLMHRPITEPLTENLAREVCLRTGGNAIVTGSIAGSSAGYAIGLKAVNCQTGRALARVEEQAAAKGAVLNTLAAAAVDLRSKLGEPPNSVQKYAISLGQATMPSLEAMKELSLGYKTEREKGQTAALPYYTRAVQLDPGFAYAYLHLAIMYINLNETARAQENGRKAYELREATPEEQRLLIEAFYYANVTGELEKTAQTYERLQQNYPRNLAAYANLEGVLDALGNYERSLEQAREALRLEPNYGTAYSNVADEYQNLNRFDEAEAMYKQAEEHHLSGETLLLDRYLLAFSQGDITKMAQMSAAAMGKPGMEDLLLASQADTEAWYGRFEKAREMTRRAMGLAQHNDATETAAIYRAEAALREVEAGNRKQARADANAALKLAQSRDVRAVAALALARAGETAAAEKLVGELDKEFPLATLVQKYWLPTIRAAVALENDDPDRAVELLQMASPIELSAGGRMAVYLCPVYVRGEAYLRLRDGRAAAAEFQKFVDHRGLLANFPWGALARLGLARAYALDASTSPAAREKARTAYQNFLTLWKDADPEIPIYQQAKAEYAKIR